jgi:tRNA threonylcarbamoyladenosine biosynthesis protein TsaB
MIEQLLENCKINRSDLQAVAVSKGPGSYTGLRIGTATAKGMCYALGIPLIAVNTLAGMAHQFVDVPDGVDFLCPMIDARRMEVYCLLLNRNFEMAAGTRAVIVNGDSFDEWLTKGKVLFFGDGSTKCRDVLHGRNSLFMKDFVPSACSIGKLARQKLERGETEDLAYFEPFYLKEYQTTIPKDKIGISYEK